MDWVLLSHSLLFYAGILRDEQRKSAYEAALKATVFPGSVVVDLGAGTGYFSLYAAKLGARRVFAIETASAILALEELAVENDLDTCITCIRGDSRTIELPERADIIVADLRGGLPYAPGNIDSLIDARDRFLCPDGVLIPRSDTVKCALVSEDSMWDNYFAGLDSNLELNLSVLQRRTLNCITSIANIRNLVSNPVVYSVLDYSGSPPRSIRREVCFTATRPGTCHGIAFWFEARLHEDIGYDTGPGSNQSAYSNRFLPFLNPVEAEAGEQIVVDIAFTEVRGRYEISWKTRFEESGKTMEFDQSTLFGEPIDLAIGVG